MRKHPRLPAPLNAEEINDRIALLQYDIDNSKRMSKKRLLKLHGKIRALRVRLLRLRPPEEWSEMIHSIRDHAVRIKVACIVWWDFFGNRSTSDRWPHLDTLVEKGCGNFSFNRTLVAKALVRLGYSASESTRRANVKTYLPSVKVDWQTVAENP